MLTCPVVSFVSFTSILPVDRLKRADLLAWLPLDFVHLGAIRRWPEARRSAHWISLLLKLDLVRRSPEVCRSVRRASLSRSARSDT